MDNYLVIGMGRFGRSIAKTLYENNQFVLAIDSNESTIQEVINENIVEDAIILDAKDEIALREKIKDSFDTAFVCVGQNIQDSILITLILKEMGIQNIICKATSKVQGRVLEKVGATRIVYPEEEMGVKLAFSVLNPNVLEYFKFNDDYSIVEMKVPKKFVGKTLLELDLRVKFDANVIALKDRNGNIKTNMQPTTILEEDEAMVVFGSSKTKQLIKMCGNSTN